MRNSRHADVSPRSVGDSTNKNYPFNKVDKKKKKRSKKVKMISHEIFRRTEDSTKREREKEVEEKIRH